MDRLTKDQMALLEWINTTYAEYARYTDQIARNMGQAGRHRESGGKWDNSHVPFIGLQLRDKGLVTTFKGMSQYARWDITPSGKAKILEERAAIRAELEAKKKPQPKYAVYESNDGSYSEVTSLEEARELASKCAKETPGELVYVVQVVESYKAEVLVKKVAQ